MWTELKIRLTLKQTIIVWIASLAKHGNFSINFNSDSIIPFGPAKIEVTCFETSEIKIFIEIKFYLFSWNQNKMLPGCCAALRTIILRLEQSNRWKGSSYNPFWRNGQSILTQFDPCSWNTSSEQSWTRVCNAINPIHIKTGLFKRYKYKRICTHVHI